MYYSDLHELKILVYVTLHYDTIKTMDLYFNIHAQINRGGDPKDPDPHPHLKMLRN